VSQPTQEEIQRLQGTRLNTEKAPWQTYSEELDVKMSPELAAEVADYSTRYHDSESSNQNKEELARWQEQNYDAMGEYRWASPEEYADIEARIGRIMHHSEFVTRLKKIGVRCALRDHPQTDKLTLLVQRGNDVLKPYEVGCWIKNGFAPEFSVMGFDEHGVPLAERYRGWRTAILQLILKQVLTEEQAHKEFGSTDRCCAGRYNSILHGIRNTVDKEEEQCQTK
jgi:hypothetical protein